MLFSVGALLAINVSKYSNLKDSTNTGSAILILAISANVIRAVHGLSNIFFSIELFTVKKAL
jgi:hypothetical protein